MSYVDPDGRSVGIESTGSRVDSVGPRYSDATYTFVTDDGKTRVSQRYVEMPGLLVQRAELTIGADPTPKGLAVRNGATSDDPQVATNDTALTLAGGTVTFQRGDVIDLDLILLPFGGPELGDDQFMRDLRQDWAVRRPVVEAGLGTVVPDRMVPTVRVGSRRPRGELARFTLTGGRGTTTFVVRVFSTTVRRPSRSGPRAAHGGPWTRRSRVTTVTRSSSWIVRRSASSSSTTWTARLVSTASQPDDARVGW